VPYDISTTERLGPGQFLTINDRTGINILAPAPGQTVVSFNNAGTILVNSDSRYLVAGINYDYGSQPEGSVFTNEATGVFRVVSTGGQNGTMGFTSVWGQTGWTGEFINHGTFEVEATAWAMGISTFNQGLAVTNTGRFVVRSGTNAFAVYANYGASVINSGLIEATGPFASAIRSIDRPSDVFNSGTIRAVTTGTEGWGIGIGLGGSGPDVSHIDNSGLIEAQYAILDETDWSFWPAVQIVTNSGRIVGMIDLARGDDTLINSGSITGEVWLGYGADVYDGRGGTHVGAIHGSFGNDVLTGGDGADVLFGEDGDDVISGGAGNDFLQGGRGDNVIDGGTGIDTLIYAGLTRGVDLDLAAGTATAAGRDQISGIENVYGSIWADHLRGDAGSNLLFGSDGADILDGRGGADTLAGGAGADTLTGGDGDDTFVFGTGDGADVITDLSTGDRLVIHGYTGGRETVQVGADVRITLSDTDSILLRNTTVSAVTSQTTFTTAPRPAYNLPGEAPELLGEVHVEIHDRFLIGAGETLIFDQGNGGLAIFGEITADAGVTNAGYIFNNGNTAGAVGITLGGYNRAGNFDNLVSGVLSVTSTHAGTTAVGVANQGSGLNASVTNAGLIDVRAVYSAYGVRGESLALNLFNTGTIHAESQGTTIGAMMGHFGSMTNDGVIEVFGGAAGGGFTFGIHSQSGTFTNNGTVTASNSTGDAVGIFMPSGSIINTGLIQADRAIDVTGALSSGQIMLDNSGEIRGTVLLTRGQDQVVNTGFINGTVTLNEGDDTYDGSGGRQSGRVDGGAGQDRLTGGASADHLTGGDGSDTLRGGGGNDLLDGGEGDDFAVFSGLRSDYNWTIVGDTITITGPDGVDTLVGIELLRFADGIVSLTGRGINVRGTGYDDTIFGCELDDVLDGGAVHPLFEMQGSTDNGEDRIFGLGGNDILTGGGRSDYLDGGTGDDQLDGGLGNDTLLGGEGNDQLTGGKGSDTLDGGNGMDVAIFTGALADFQIVTVNGVTTVTGPDGVDRSNRPLTAVDVLTNIERLQFSDQVLDLRPNLVVGTAGNDILTGSAAADSLFGGDGDDELHGGLGDDWIEGGDGWDTLWVEGDSSEYRILVVSDGFLLKGADGTDHLIGVEAIRFSQGGEIDLARQYGFGGLDPQTLPPTGGKDEGPSTPSVLPGPGPDDAFLVAPGQNDDAPFHPGLPEMPAPRLSTAGFQTSWFEVASDGFQTLWPADYGLCPADNSLGGNDPGGWDLLA
tara:strand:+ start:524 stop:4273 length:3750 start_codon:yes stop_codon:yes gene_type:complete